MSEDLDPVAITGTSDEAVVRATGKPWAEWLAILDTAGGREMNHKQIVAHLQAHTDVSSWWQQQLTCLLYTSRCV